jgi:hypothetical protein
MVPTIPFACKLKFRPRNCKQFGGSGLFIPDPDFFPSCILDPESNKKRKKNKRKNFLHCNITSPTAEGCLKFHKIKNYLHFLTGTEKELSQLTKEILIKKIVTKLFEIWVGYGIRTKIYSGSRAKKHRIPDPQHTACELINTVTMGRSDDKCCPVCGLLINSKRFNFKQHLKIHTGEKPFVCQVCSRAFRQKAHMVSSRFFCSQPHS